MTADPSDRASLDEAFVAAYPRLIRLASLIVGSEAEDAVMEAYLRVRSRPRELREPTGYLRTAVLNECRTRWRHAMRPPPLVEGTGVAAEPEIDAVWHVIAELPGDQRAVVALRFYEDLTVPQIAEVLEMPAGTVKSHLHRAMQALRTTIGDPR